MLCRADSETRDELEGHFETWLQKKDSSFSKIANFLVRDEKRIRQREEKRKRHG